MEDRFNSEYAEFVRWKTISNEAMWITIIISCLGLFGFATLHLSGRYKEIGIRKVFGGTSQIIMWEITWPFAILVFLGTTFALPVSYYLMKQYLHLFAFHISIRTIDYFVPFIAVLGIIILALIYHFIRMNRFRAAEILKEE